MLPCTLPLRPMRWSAHLPRQRVYLSAAGAALATLLGAFVAVGEAGTAAVRFDARVVAPVSCPNSESFAKGVSTRTHLARRVDSEEAELMLDVTISADGDRSRGVLRMTSRDGQISSREVVAPSCEAVTDALAFVAALAIDPNAVSEPDGASVPGDDEVREPDATDAPLQEPSADKPTTPDPFTDSGVAPSETDRAGARLWLSVWVAAEAGTASSAPSPELARRGGLRVGLGDAESLGVDVELGVVRRVGDAAIDGVDGRATLALWGGHGRGCVRVPFMGSSVFRGCGGIEGGVLRATGWNVQIPREEQVGWWAGSAGAGLELPVVGPLFALADASLLFPLRRDQFVLSEAGDQRVLFRPPGVAFVSQFGLGFRLNP